MDKKLTPAAIQQAATLLRTGTAEIKTVAKVESSGSGFLADGRVVIRFEPHIFHARTGGRYAALHPELSYKTWVPDYPRSTTHSWNLFNAACTLNPTAAVLSTSWGLFQIMGFNYTSCNCNSLSQFVALMESGEDAQLNLFAQYLLITGLDDELRNHLWAAFARLYNGAQYLKNHYDTLLAHWFAHFSRP